MRRDEFDGESQGVRGRKRGAARPSSSTKSHLRRLAMEKLESRELLATTQIPTPTLISTASLVSNSPLTALPNSSAPEIAVDPVDPTKLVAAWNVYDPADAIGGQITGYVQAAFSTDGGQTWNELPGDTSADEQLDFSQSQANGPVFFAQTTNASIAFGRDQNVYLLSSTHNAGGTAGVFDLQRFDFTGASPSQTLVNNQIYAWDGQDVAANPTIAVDSNVPSFTDVNSAGATVTQRDPFAGNVYIAWSQTDTPPTPTPTNFQPNTIKMVASDDDGNDFTHEAYVDNTSNANLGEGHNSAAGAHYTAPTIAISQGGTTASGTNVPGGQVTIVYDEYGTGSTGDGNAVEPGQAYDNIVDQTDLVGGTSSTWSALAPVQITLAIKGMSGVDFPQTTILPVNVDITDPKFTTLQALDVSLEIAYPDMQDLSAVLVPPTGSGLQPITLFANGIDDTGASTGTGLTGSGLGENANTGFNPSPGTVFDQDAVRSIADPLSVASPYLGHYQPADENDLTALQGSTAAQLNGVWQLQITAFRNEAEPIQAFVNSFSLNFSSGNNPGFNPTTGRAVREVTIANFSTAIASPDATNINPAVASNPLDDTLNQSTTGVTDSGTTTNNIQTPAVLPSVSVAVDNTLGSYSQHPGRIYVAYTGRFGQLGLPAADTEINLLASDDGGKTWTAIDPDAAGVAALAVPAVSTGVQVNDANAVTDGYSGSTPGGAGRPAIQPQVAVDNSTGTVVLSYFDTRNDSAQARVSTYIAVSTDGGNTFSPQTYANASTVAIDSATGNPVNLGPVPDNESSGNPNAETVFGFGEHQGLAVSDGKIFAAWSSNENEGSATDNVPLSIVDSVLTMADGPRIVSSTMGPVGLPGDTINTTVAADGSPVANSFEVTFDRPIDPATFQGDGATAPIGSGDVRVFYQDPYPATVLDNTTSLALVAGLTQTSTLTEPNLPGESIVDGTVALSLSGYSNLSAITVTLTTPNGQTYTVPVNTIAGASSSTSFTNASFTLPANIVGGPVSAKDGSGNLIPYKLTVNPGGQTGVTLVNWQVQLNGISTGLRVLSVQPVPDLTDPLDDGTLGYTTFKVVFQPINPDDGVTTSVGTYSYVVRPNLSDRIRQVGAPLLSAGVTGLVVTGPGNDAASDTGAASSTVTVSGHPNQVIVSNPDDNTLVTGAFPIGNIAGTVTATAVVGGMMPMSGNLSAFIATPDGQRYALNGVSSGNTLQLTNVAFSIPFTSVSLDGQYTLEVEDDVDAPGSQTIQITAFQMTLNGVIQNTPAAPITVAAAAPQVPKAIAADTTGTSTLTFTGHPGDSISEGLLNLSLTAVDVSQLTIVLTGTGTNETFTLPAQAAGTSINGQFLLPVAFDGQTLNGTYTLKITAPINDAATLTSWSLTLTPQNYNLPATTVVADAQPLALITAGQTVDVAQLPAPLVGANTSMTTLVLAGHPGKTLEEGTVTVNLTDTDVSNLTIVLQNPEGVQFTLPAATGTALGQTFSLPANFIGLAIDGTYTLFVTGSNAADNGVLTGWSISLVPQGLNGNSMDQNADGTGGEDQETTAFTGTTPGDDYAVPGPVSTTTATYNTSALPAGPYDPATLPLIVSGAHVVTTSITGTGNTTTGPATTADPIGATTGDTTDALVVNDEVGAATVTYDRNVQINSVATQVAGEGLVATQVASINGPAGSISSPQAFNATSIADTFASTDVGVSIPKGGVASPLVSTLNIFNTGVTVSSLNVTLDITDPNDSSLSITLEAPDGTMIPLAINEGGAGANFTNTVFSNTPPANGLSIPIASGTAPFSETYTPESPLTALAGKSLDGTWSLIISDNSAAGTPLGRLNSWSLGVVPHVPQAANTNLTSTLTINNPDDSFKIGHLAVQLNITAPKDSDIGAILVAPDGTEIVLFNQDGGTGSNFDNTIFDEGAANPSITTGIAPFIGTYKPLNLTQFGFSTLTAQNGKAINGTWKLIINDQTTDGQAVTLNSWSLIATPLITVTPSEVYTSLDTSTTTYVSTDTSQQVYQSSDLTAANDKIPTVLGQSVSSSIQFTPSPTGTTNPFLIANLEVALSITYLHDTNLSVSLTAPNGTTIPLFTGVGGQGANFGGAAGFTIFSDSGTESIANGTAPFSANTLPPTAGITIYRPESTLSVLEGLALNAGTGTWTLKVTNNRTNGPAGGTFNGWALLATPQNAPAANGLPLGSVQPVEPIPVIAAQPATGPGSAGLPLSSIITFPTASSSTILSSNPADLLSATLSFAGQNLADLSAVLIAPDGVQATLFTAGTLTGTSVTKTFTPVNPISGLGQFAGVPLYFLDPTGANSNGNWTLEVFDKTAADGKSGGGGGGLLTGWSLGVTPAAVALGQAPEPVPITPASSLTSTITIPDNYPLNDLRLRLDLIAPKDSDLSAMLIGPNNTAIQLFTNIGGAGIDFSNTLFDDNAANSIDSGTAPFSGTYKPENPLSNFIAGGLTSAAGTWKLVIIDNKPLTAGGLPDGLQAVLNSWSLINTPPSNATLANSYQFSFPTQQLSGTYTLTLGAGIIGANPDVLNPATPSNPSDGFAVNPNLDAGVDVLTGKATTGSTATSKDAFSDQAVSVPITAGTTSKGTTTPSVLSAQVDVTDNFLIEGITSTGLPGLTVTLNITFPNDPNLSAVLISPAGTMITLFSNVGNGANRANFGGPSGETIFDDTVSPLAPIASAGAPFFGSFNPQDPLSGLAGESSGGIWTLQITNDGTSVGSLNNFTLTFQKPLPSSGLGDPVADRQTVNFRIFNIAPTNPLANDTWTAVGPAGVTTTAGSDGTFAGSVASIAYDPSDPTTNTVYVGSSSGGIWKTTDFLTNAPGGPTYVPLTDFGPDYGLDTGSIAVLGRNNDPDQSIVIAGTGFADGTYSYTGPNNSPTYANYGGDDTRGVGFLRSYDGGATWTVLDSMTNVDSSGNPLPEDSPLRNHQFVGDYTYKVVIDPTAEANGDIVIYAAMGGPTGGLYRSTDSGNNWTLLSSGFTDPTTGGPAAATDVLLDPQSKDSATGQLENVYAAFEGLGVYQSTNQGQGLKLLAGMEGSDPLIVGTGFPAQATPVGFAGDTPNGANGRIILAKPALTQNVATNIIYQDWLYAAVENTDGTLNGLYVTKDLGQNWTKVDLGTLPTPTTVSITVATPTNDNTAESYDPTANAVAQNTTHFQNGNYALTLTIDPTNPNIVYLGGSTNFQDTGLIRIDLTDLYDAHNFTSFSNTNNDGGLLTENTTGAVQVLDPTTEFPTGALYPTTAMGPTPYLDLRHAPNDGAAGTSPFNVNATLVVAGATEFTNSGTGVIWSYFDEPLKANAGDATGSTNLHDSIAYIDPVTGNVRLIFADDQGVFTALVNPDGTLDDGIGTDVAANYSRNGNLQDEQFYYGAAQPSNVAAQAAGALFYASGQGLLAAQSNADILNNGDITWDDSAVLNTSDTDPTSLRNTTANTAIESSDRGGVGIATDQDANSGSVYEFDIPSLGGNLTDFFRVNQAGQTTGLDNNFAQEFPFGGFRFDGTTGNDGTISAGGASGLIPEGNFTVNPLDDQEVLISSATGNLYQSASAEGFTFSLIGTGANFGQAVGSPQAYASAIAYGAPESLTSVDPGSLDQFIYVGTVGGNDDNAGIFVTQTGGQAQGTNPGWTNISAGLDGSTVVGIYPSPDRGSHEAYAVTLEGVYYTPDALTTAWINITGNLEQIQHNSFDSAGLAESVFSTYGAVNGTDANGASANAQYGGFRSIVADYRYAIPDLSGAVHPVLYVAGYGGVFRSLDNGQTWTVFPNTAFDSAPVDGGYLPSVDVTNLQLNLGTINPATGRPTEVAGDPEVLLASTFGRGEFAIRLAPDVFPTTIELDPNLPAPTGSDSGTSNIDKITNVKNPYIDGVSEISNFGNSVYITLTDESNGDIIAAGYTNAFGQFSIQVGTFATPPAGSPTLTFNDPSFLLDGTKNVGIQATDSAGAKGNITTFTYILKATPPASPGTPVLETASDSFGANGTNHDDKTNVLDPTFDITTLEPSSSEVELLRFDPATSKYDIVAGTAPAGISPVRITDTTLASLANNGLLSGTFMYEATQIDIAGNQSVEPSGILTIVVDNIPPVPPTGITLDPNTNSSGSSTSPIVTNAFNPKFDVTGVLPGDQVFLYRSINGGTPMLVGSSAVNNTTSPASTTVYDIPGIHGADGIYTYEVLQVDVFGNQSTLAKSPIISINDIQSLPPAPTLLIFPADDTGAPTNPGITRVNDPRFFGTVSGSNVAGLTLDIINATTGQILARTTVASDGSYLTQVVGPIADGTYTFEAKTTNAAGNSNFSAPLTLTIKAEAPQDIPTLSLLPADDTGLKNDGVTANRRPIFIGTTNPGVTVKLYSVGANGALTFQAQTVSSTVNGSFQIQVASTLVNGITQLVAQASDIAGNVGQLSPVLNVQIVTVASDYYDTGTAQLTVFDPTTETYIVRNAGQSAPVDSTPGSAVPVQDDLDSDGRTDLVGYQFNSATYVGTQSSLGPIDRQYGAGGVALPVSGYYSGNGNYIDAAYNPASATWAVNLPTPGGVNIQYGYPGVDIPAPAAYNGGGFTQVAVFRPVNLLGTPGDTFYVYDYYAPGASTFTSYSVSFQQFGNFTYKVGDIPAPADYDGVGHDEFAIYRPTTGQFFIINTPNVLNPATWTLETKTINLPGGPQATDEPASADYDGNGHIDPTVYRPSNSTFYVLHSSTGIQENIQFGTPGNVAAAGPLLYRLSALTGQYQTKDGYPQNGNTSYGPPTGGLSADAFDGTVTVSGGSTGSTVSIVTPAIASPAILTASTPATSTAYYAAVSPKDTIVSGTKTPKVTVAGSHPTKAHAHAKVVKPGVHAKVVAKPKAVKIEATQPVIKPHVTPTSPHQPKPKATKVEHDAVASAIHHIGSIKKGQRHV